MLAYHALRWFLKAYNGNKNTELGKQWQHFSDTKYFHSSHFYKPAFDFLLYLNGLVEFDLFTCGTELGFEPIRDALFTDLTLYWKGSKGARDSHLIHDTWCNRIIGMNMSNRESVCLYHEVACGSSMLRDTLRRKGLGDGLCRHGCGIDETMDHVFHECSAYSSLRVRVRNLCIRFSIDMTTVKIMTDKRLQSVIEEWLYSIGLIRIT